MRTSCDRAQRVCSTSSSLSALPSSGGPALANRRAAGIALQRETPFNRIHVARSHRAFELASRDVIVALPEFEPRFSVSEFTRLLLFLCNQHRRRVRVLARDQTSRVVVQKAFTLGSAQRLATPNEKRARHEERESQRRCCRLVSREWERCAGHEGQGSGEPTRGQKQLFMAPSALVAFLRQSSVLERKRRPTQSVINRSLNAA